MNAETATALRCRIESDPDADLSSLETETDTVLAIGRDVWRLRWRNQITTAVTEDANLHTTCGALLDALAVLETTTAERDRALDRSTMNVLIDRPLPNGGLSETDQAVRSLREAVSGVQARIWYRRDDAGWAEGRRSGPDLARGRLDRQRLGRRLPPAASHDAAQRSGGADRCCSR